jgi:uncharacterized protein with NRDE domain
MCTIAILVGVADAPVILAANRDELYARRSRPPQSWETGLAGGSDVESGGTWLALRRDGAFAAVTNQRALAPVAQGVALQSRGQAVRDVARAVDQDAAVAALDPKQYGSMNLVWGDARGAVSVAYLRNDTGERTAQRLEPGVHVLCNDVLGSQLFPRGDRLRAGIAAALAAGPRWDALQPKLAALLADHTQVAPPPSHLSDELARAMTATCIHTPMYGTRSATLACLDAGRVRAYSHAEGSPCTHAFVDYTGLLA